MMTAPLARLNSARPVADEVQLEADFWLALYVAIHGEAGSSPVTLDDQAAAAAAEAFIAILARHLGPIRAAKVLIALGPRAGRASVSDALRFKQHAAMLGIRRCSDPSHEHACEPGERRLETPFGCICVPAPRSRTLL